MVKLRARLAKSKTSGDGCGLTMGRKGRRSFVRLGLCARNTCHDLNTVLLEGHGEILVDPSRS